MLESSGYWKQKGPGGGLVLSLYSLKRLKGWGEADCQDYLVAAGPSKELTGCAYKNHRIGRNVFLDGLRIKIANTDPADTAYRGTLLLLKCMLI